MTDGSTNNNMNMENNLNVANTQMQTTQYVDQLGNPIDPSLIDANGNYIGAPAPTIPQYVDEFGNPIDPSLIDANGNYIGATQPAQPSMPQYVDEFGNPIDPSLIDANGNYIGATDNTMAPTIDEHTVAQELNNASGNIVEASAPVVSAAVESTGQKEMLTGMVTFDYNNVPITDIVNSIILDSINKGASDIHLDPFDEGIKIRLRIDGELNDYSIVPLYVKRNMITRIKIISGMNITESRVPQDGAIRTELQNKTIDLRVSCLPTNVGEKIVIRIMDYSMSAQGIEALDFSENNLDKVKRMLELPNGIILVTGATGSGKSTTVYSMLQRLNVEGTNLITVEDPIEMNIGGINQVQAQSEIGLTFAAVLRSILRQDPDVIMIGEIRDDETARIAVRASITGHLVLSTIHTNNALNTIERLTDMSVERYLLGSSLSGVISQKLARRLCPKCKRLRKTTDYEKSIIKTTLEKDVDEIYEPVGCPECSRGYRGRIAVHEVLLLNQKVRDAITKGVSKAELREQVYSHHGTDTMLEDGLKKVLQGETSFEEILKLIDLEDDLGTGTQLGLVNQIEASTFNNDDPTTNLLKDPELSGPQLTSPAPTSENVEVTTQKPGPQLPPVTQNAIPTQAQISGPIDINIPPELMASLSGLTSLKSIADELAKVNANGEKEDDEPVEETIIRKKKKKPKKVIIEEIVEEDEDSEPETIVRRISSKDLKKEKTDDADIVNAIAEIPNNVTEDTTTPKEESVTIEESIDNSDNSPVTVEETSESDISEEATEQPTENKTTAEETVDELTHEGTNKTVTDEDSKEEYVQEAKIKIDNTTEIFDNEPIYIDLKDIEYLTSLIKEIPAKEFETVNLADLDFNNTGFKDLDDDISLTENDFNLSNDELNDLLDVLEGE